jgi:hypothetical protein
MRAWTLVSPAERKVSERGGDGVGGSVYPAGWCCDPQVLRGGYLHDVT